MNLFVSLMRTIVPLIVGWLLTLAVRAGIHLDSVTVTGVVTVAITAAYYLVFRVLERAGEKANGTVLQRIAGVLLGWARPPSYPPQPTSGLSNVSTARLTP